MRMRSRLNGAADEESLTTDSIINVINVTQDRACSAGAGLRRHACEECRGKGEGKVVEHDLSKYVMVFKEWL